MPLPHDHRPPRPSNFRIKGMAPRTHIDTINSDPGHVPGPLETSRFFHAPPPPKRHKNGHSGARPRAPVEDIADSEQDVRSRTGRQGSQASLAQSASPGLFEYQSVEASAKPGRSNRRTRRSPGNHFGSGALPVPPKRNQVAPEAIEDDFDELKPAQKPEAHQQRTARLVSTSATKHSAIIRDAADEQILGKQVRPKQQAQGPNRGKKRTSHEITEDAVEMTGDVNGRGVLTTNAEPQTEQRAEQQEELRAEPRAEPPIEPPAESPTAPPIAPPTENSERHNPPSLSRRGDLNPTTWTKKPNTGVRVYSAVCNPNLRYLPTGGVSPCALRPNDTELRALAEDGSPAEPFNWLKITAKTRSLHYHSESDCIKIHQPMDQSSPTQIGGLMVLKFFNKSDAAWVVDWVRQNLKVTVTEEKESSKLVQVYDRVDQDVTRANGRSWARRHSDDALILPPRPLTTSAEHSDGAPPSSRTPMRHQMQISAQTPLLPRAEPSSQPVASGPRSLRTRQVQVYGRVQRVEDRSSPVYRRWTEENPDWAKDWKMPLTFHRTTVNKEDIARLDDGQYLNDNLIEFGLKYLFEKFNKRHQDLSKRVYVHNTFFFDKLKVGKNAINYDGVRNWTSKVDLLSYDYIVVPINEDLHWWVAIICNPGKLDPDSRVVPGKSEGPGKHQGGEADKGSSDVEMTDVNDKLPTTSPREPDLVKSDIVDLISDDKNARIDLTSGNAAIQSKKPGPSSKRYNPKDPRIITLDSMGHPHSPAVSQLRKYLLAEFQHKRGKILTNAPDRLGMTAVHIPIQNNYHDCGVYLLGYIQEFVQNPDQFIQTLLRREDPDWDFDASELRALWRETIKGEHKWYQNMQLGVSAGSREASAARNTPNGSANPSSQRSSKAREVHSGTTHMDKMVASKQSTPAKTPGTPMNQDVYEVDDSDPEPAPHVPRGNSKECIPSTSPSNGLSPGKPSDEDGEEPEKIDEEVVILEPEANVLPSIEDEPKFVSQLPSSPRGSPELDCVAEVTPKAFYQSARSSINSRKGSSALSSPGAVGQQGLRGGRGVKKTQPAVNTHTASRFVLADGAVPVVERAELVRNSEAIDLTD